MEAKVYGTFTKSNGLIYRTKTYIQFGQSEEIIGACVLCNPGSATLKNQIDKDNLERFEGYKVTQGEVKDDNTIRQLIKILRGKGGEKLKGRFLIFNLFTLVHPDMEYALTLLKDKAIDIHLLDEDYFNYKEKRSSIPWILVGWGCKKNGDLNKLKDKWLECLKKDGINLLGKKHKVSPHYYHPLPRIYVKQTEYVEEAISQINDLVQMEGI